ncbi:hypothetical protein CONPUDRAFT_133136 [Coniophora puteana RWD-64-598 SS2]|uniref:Uncharacterized protein n=1 Tax=Coniophora puteana (strain RWD-64-598) TaxID=741705 RepID=R7SE68_CONPW|nr:uncharacterized protein CONPUDRAFT_133136 [Coniophora puteana RWD-64-598 SS2]EIW74471.1 hypothetical protein CONPUDRAFT_133136 [Coniophora puteana RWD-64-598 SS2]
MLSLARQEWHGPDVPKERFLAQYWAWSGLCNLLKTGTVPERRSVLENLIDNGAMELCMQHFRHELSLMRHQAACTMHTLSFAGLLGEMISPSKAAEFIEAVCGFALQGPAYFITQLDDPAMKWQINLFMDPKNESPEKLQIFAPHIYAQSSDSALYGAHDLLNTYPPRPRKFCLEIIRSKPHLLDLLFDCAILDRPKCYPETQVSKTACEVLALLFDWPMHAVPGVTLRDKTSKDLEWKAFSQLSTALVSRPKWTERLIEVWMHLEEEGTGDIESWFVGMMGGNSPLGTVSRVRASTPLEARGVCRVVTLRLIATLTHAAEPCGISNAHIESFLHVAYQCCVKAGPPMEECKTADAMMRSMEYKTSIVYNLPHPMTPSGDSTTDTPFVVAPQEVLGPTTLIRLLVVLAQRNALDGIQTLVKAPYGLSTSTSLRHVQQITHPEVITRTIKIAQRRILLVVERTRKGLIGHMNAEDTINSACMHFATAAELAAALVALDVATKGTYAAEICGARKRLVITLGNAARMALTLKQYQRALHYIMGAVAAAEDISPDEGLELDIIEKNIQRLDEARRGLRNLQSRAS